MDSSENEDESVRLHLSWLLVGVWHEAAHKVGLAVVKSRLRKDARARAKGKIMKCRLRKVQGSNKKGVWAKCKIFQDVSTMSSPRETR